MSDTDTLYVVIASGEPAFVSDDKEMCRDVAGKITAGHGVETTIHGDVSYEFTSTDN